MTTVSDTVDNAQIAQRETGFTARRSFTVSGVAGVGAARMRNALNEPGIPAIGDPHPDEATIACTNKIVVTIADEPGIFRVDCDYSASEALVDDVRIEYGSSLISEETIFDINDALMQTTYNQPPIVIKTHLVQVDRPQLTMTARVRKLVSALSVAQSHTGAVNDATWGGFAPKTWLCTAVRGTDLGGSGVYDHTYEFIYNPETWIATVSTQISGQIPPDAVIGNGIEQYDVYPTANFALFGFSPT